MNFFLNPVVLQLILMRITILNDRKMLPLGHLLCFKHTLNSIDLNGLWLCNNLNDHCNFVTKVPCRETKAKMFNLCNGSAQKKDNIHARFLHENRKLVEKSASSIFDKPGLFQFPRY